MGRRQYDPTYGDLPEVIQPIAQGGTSATSAVQAAQRLGALSITRSGQPGGFAGLDSDAKIPVNKLQTNIFKSTVSVIGAQSVYINSVTTYTIDPYSPLLTYTITAVSGTVSRTGNTITYTAPATPGSGGFVINGRTYPITVMYYGVIQPSVITPTTGATNQNSTVNFTASAFQVAGPADTHAGSDWQLSTDTGFGTIIQSVTNSPTYRTSWSVTALSPNTVYYVRARYKGTSDGYSSWSTTITFTTKANFYPSQNVSYIPNPWPNGLPGGSPAQQPQSQAIFNPVNLDLFIGGGGNGGSMVEKYNPSTSTTWILDPATPTNGSFASSMDWGGSGGFGPAPKNYIAITGDGNTLAIGDGRNVTIYSRSGESYTVVQTISSAVGTGFGATVCLSADGLYLVIANNPSSFFGGISTVQIYAKSAGSYVLQQSIQRPVGGTDNGFGIQLVISPANTQLTILSTSNGPFAYVYTRSGSSWALTQSLALRTPASPVKMILNADGSRLAVGDNGYVSIYGLVSNTWVLQDQILVTGTVDDLVFSPIDSNLIFVSLIGAGYYTSVRVLKYSNSAWAFQPAVIASSSGEPNSRLALAITPDGSTLVTTLGGYTIFPNYPWGMIFQ